MKQETAYLVDAGIRYPSAPPYDPEESYPELTGLGIQANGVNTTYAAVRELFELLRLDEANIGTTNWNPFGEFIAPGTSVFIKPNLVLHEMKHTVGTNCVTTHASVLRPIIDYCVLAGGKNVRITVGDVPLQSANFDEVVEDNGLRALIEHCRTVRGIDICLLDLRPMRQDATEDFYFEKTIEQPGDPRGYSVVDLGEYSSLESLCAGKQPHFTVTDYDAGDTRAHHTRGKHEYYVCNSVLEADVFINVPKLKTHEKAGITVNMKNLVGINGQKSWLPHFRKGSVAEGGDEWNQFSIRKTLHSRARALLQGRSKTLWRVARFCWHLIRPPKKNESKGNTAAEFFEMGGAWHGNDTVWRMVTDLNAIILYYSTTKGWCESRPRTYFFVIDGIVAGENHGPLFPHPKAVGCLIGGFEPVLGDMVAASIMGFDWQKIPLLRETVNFKKYPLLPHDDPESAPVASRDGVVPLRELDVSLRFVPAPGWRGAIEKPDASAMPK